MHVRVLPGSKTRGRKLHIRANALGKRDGSDVKVVRQYGNEAGGGRGYLRKNRMPCPGWNTVALCIRGDLYQASLSCSECLLRHSGSDLLDIVCHRLDATNSSRPILFCKIFSPRYRLDGSGVASTQLNDAGAGANVTNRNAGLDRSCGQGRLPNGPRSPRSHMYAAVCGSTGPGGRTGSA